MKTKGLIKKVIDIGIILAGFLFLCFYGWNRDLQCYVAAEEYTEALAAYRQEELIYTVEELKEACPNYEMLMDEYFKTEYGENLLETDKIYRLETADGESCFPVRYTLYGKRASVNVRRLIGKLMTSTA